MGNTEWKDWKTSPMILRFLKRLFQIYQEVGLYTTISFEEFWQLLAESEHVDMVLDELAQEEESFLSEEERHLTAEILSYLQGFWYDKATIREIVKWMNEFLAQDKGDTLEVIYDRFGIPQAGEKGILLIPKTSSFQQDLNRGKLPPLLHERIAEWLNLPLELLASPTVEVEEDRGEWEVCFPDLFLDRMLIQEREEFLEVFFMQDRFAIRFGEWELRGRCNVGTLTFPILVNHLLRVAGHNKIFYIFDYPDPMVFLAYLDTQVVEKIIRSPYFATRGECFLNGWGEGMFEAHYTIYSWKRIPKGRNT